MDPHFTIETNLPALLTGLPLNTNIVEFMGDAAPLEQGAPILPLAQALNMAVKQNRAYQSAKEQVFFQRCR